MGKEESSSKTHKQKLSLYPLRFEEAVTSILETKPEKKKADESQPCKTNAKTPR